MTGRIIDYVGGLDDIRERRVRMIGNPDIRLREDPVRILRALRIAAKTGLDIDPELQDALPRHRGELARCAKPRLFEETMRLFRGGQAERSLKQLVEYGLLEILIPPLAGHLAAIDPGHDEPAVFAYMRALDRVAERGVPTDVLILGALLHAPAEHAVADEDGSLRSTALVERVLEAAQALGATRKMLDRLRQVVTTQRYFERPSSTRRPRRKVPLDALARRPHFPEALDLFEIIGRGSTDGEPIEALRGMLLEAQANPDLEGEEGEEPPMIHGEGGAAGPGRRRRRRRGGRGGEAKPTVQEA